MTSHSRPIWTNADAYETIMGRWSRPAAREALAWLALPSNLDWLDLGCGTGALTQAILETANPRTVVGVDPSEEFLALAAEPHDDSRVSFAVGNAQSIPAQDDRFDVAISGLVLHFVPDPQVAAVEMARTVKRGGTVATYIWDVDDPRQFTRPFWKAAAEIDPAAEAWDPRTQFQVRSTEALSHLWTQAELREVAASRLVMPIVFRDFDDYWQPCLLNGTTPIQRYVLSLDEEHKELFRERLRSVLPASPDGSIPLSGRLLIVRGTK